MSGLIATVRINIEPDWQEQTAVAVTPQMERLGLEILADAERYVPVDTGRLQASLDTQTVPEGENGWPEVQIGSFDDDEGPVEYAAAVEMGFHGEEWVREYINHDFMGRGEEVLIRAHARHANTPEQQYLRPALYQERDL